MSIQTAVICSNSTYNQDVFFWILRVHWAPGDNGSVAVTVFGPDDSQIAYGDMAPNSTLPFQSGSLQGTVGFDGTGLTVYPLTYDESGNYDNPFYVVSNIHQCGN
jgi:hypothetical protein